MAWSWKTAAIGACRIAFPNGLRQLLRNKDHELPRQCSESVVPGLVRLPRPSPEQVAPR